MAKYKTYNTERRKGESLDQWLRRLAKVADQRLVRLEKASNEEGFKEATRYAYAKAMKDIQKWGGGTRFNRKISKKLNGNKYKIAKINDIITFLESPSSTKSGIVEVYKKRADTLNETFSASGLNITWEDLSNLEYSGALEKIRDYGSKTFFKMIAAIKKSEQSLIDEIIAGKSHEKITDDSVIDAKIKKYLKESGDNFEYLK